MDYEDYEDYEPTDEFSLKLNELVTDEVKARMKQTVDELESTKKNYGELLGKLHEANTTIRTLKATHEKELKEAVKVAQREYWFDCAVGDKVFLLDKKLRFKTCDRCGGSQKVKVIVDSVEVAAECPICGTYKKREKLQCWEYSIVEGIVNHLQIELNESHKWIRVWLKGSDNKYEIEYGRVFRTREECQVAYNKAIKGSDNENA